MNVTDILFLSDKCLRRPALRSCCMPDAAEFCGKKIWFFSISMDIVKLQIQKKGKELLFLFSKVYSGGLRGIDGYVVQVEADVSNGLPGFYMVGSLASEVKEAEERVRTAMRNSGYHLSSKKITVNLSPANVRKEGTACDLPVAVAVLAAYGIVMQPE